MLDLLVLLAITGLMHAARSFAPAVGAGGAELAFGYLLLAAYFAGRMGSRIGLPRVTTYVLAGVVTGPFVLGLVTGEMTATLRIVGSAATAILAMTAGGQLDLDRIRPVLRTLRAITVFGVLATMAALTCVLFVLRPVLPLFAGVPAAESLAVCAVLGVALSAQSPTVVTALLAETRAEGPLSRVVLATVVLADLVVIVVYSIVAAVAGAALDDGSQVMHTVAAIVWELLGSLAAGVVIGAMLGLLVRLGRANVALVVVVVCAAIGELGPRLHLDPLVVMLAAGVWLRNFSRADATELLVGFEAAELPVVLVCFSFAGSRLDLHDLWRMSVPVAIVAAARAAILFVGCRFACARTGAEPAVTRFGWTGLLPQAGLSLALVVVLQNNLPTFGPSAAMLLLGVVGVNQLIAPLLLRFGLVRSGEAGQRPVPGFAMEPGN